MLECYDEIRNGQTSIVLQQIIFCEKEYRKIPKQTDDWHTRAFSYS